MIVITVPSSDSNSLDVQLPHANLKVDPRHMGNHMGHRFRLSLKGRTLTITRIDEDGGWRLDFYLRAYLLTDTIRDFTSTVYTYWGLEYEFAPRDTTKVIFAPSVTTINEMAFIGCDSLVRVKIPGTITEIEEYAVDCCDSLRFIQLSANLEFIGEEAFCHCKSLEAVFLPPTFTHIGSCAFYNCESLKFCILPGTIDHVGHSVFYGCDRLLTTVNYKFDYEDEEDYDDDDDYFPPYDEPINNDEVNEWMMERYANLPFHQACSSISITPQVIVHGIERATEVDEYRMTALHILCANPHVTSDCIRAYLQLAPEAAECQDFE